MQEKELIDNLMNLCVRNMMNGEYERYNVMINKLKTKEAEFKKYGLLRLETEARIARTVLEGMVNQKRAPLTIYDWDKIKGIVNWVNFAYPFVAAWGWIMNRNEREAVIKILIGAAIVALLFFVFIAA